MSAILGSILRSVKGRALCLQLLPRYNQGMEQPNILTLHREIAKEFPNFKIRLKSQSWLMKTINVLLLILTFGRQKTFMTSFVTTLGSTVYVPDSWSSWNPTAQCITLRHERVHMRQSRKYGWLLFSLLYLFCWLPLWRAKWRTKFEMEAYEESMRSLLDYGGDPSNFVYKAKMIRHFTSAEYGWMWTKEKDIEDWFDRTLSRLLQRN